MGRDYHDREWLYDQYIINNRTVKSICEECGVRRQSVERYLKKYNIRKFKVGEIPTADEIRSYVNLGYGITKIVSMYPGVGDTTIQRIMDENGIKPLSPGEQRSNWWNNMDNRKRMSNQRLQLWQNSEYRKKAMLHLTDRDAITARAIKKSATYQGISIDEWDGFLTPKQTRIRHSEAYAEWRRTVFQRDNFTCQCCGARSSAGHPVELHAHHLENFAHNQELRFDVDNGITLCYDCHDIRAHGSFHNLYGIHSNTRQQFEEYMIMRLKGGQYVCGRNLEVFSSERVDRLRHCRLDGQSLC